MKKMYFCRKDKELSFKAYFNGNRIILSYSNTLLVTFYNEALFGLETGSTELSWWRETQPLTRSWCNG